MTLATAAPPARRALMPTAAAAAASALAVAVVPSAIGWVGYLWVLFALATGAAVALAVVDTRTLTLPNRFVAPLACSALVLVAGGAWYGRSPVPALVAAAVVLGVYAVMAALRWCGAGDAKFAAALTLLVGLYVGMLALYLLPMALVISSAQIAGSRLVSPEARRHAHGPAIAASAIVLMAVGVAIATTSTPS